jgi:hypothetical protein
LLLPAAYHFAITSGDEETAQQQHKDILSMSHGVSKSLQRSGNHLSYINFQHAI